MINRIYIFFKNRPLLVVGLIFLFWAILNLIWAGFNKTEPHLDMTRHLYNSLIYDQEMKLKNPLRAFVFWIDAYQYYPPLLYVVTKPFYVFSHKVFWAIASNIIWLSILIFSVYGIAKKLWNSKAGLITVLLLAATPIFIGVSKEYMLELPLTAWVFLTVYLILRSENFSNQIMNLFLGLVLGLGMLLKWTYPAFIIFPLAYVLFLTFRLCWKKKNFTQLVHIIFIFITGLAVAFPWYFVHRLALKRDFIINGINLAEGDPHKLTDIFTWIYYPVQALNFYFFLPLGLIIFAGLILCVIYKKYRQWYLLGGLLVSWIIFSLLPNKDVRYFIPSLPYAVLLTANVLSHLKMQKIFVGLIIILGLFYQFQLLIGPPEDKRILIPISQKPDLDLAIHRRNYYTTTPASNKNWHTEDIVKAIKEQISQDYEPEVVFTGLQLTLFNYYTILYYSQIEPPGFSLNDSQNDWRGAEFGILRYYPDNSPYPSAITASNLAEFLAQTPTDHPAKLLATFNQPDSGKINIYDLRGQ